MKNIRIENIELRRTSYKENPYEFVKWYPNTYYKQEEKMLSEGYTDTGHSLRKGNVSVSYSCFEHPESCYVIAWLKKDNDGWYMETVGDRLLDLSIEERNIFFDIYKKADKKLNK